MGGGGSGGVANERGDVDVAVVEVVQVDGPAPDGGDDDEGDAIGQGKGQAEGVELRLDGRIAVHGGQLDSLVCRPPSSVLFAADAWGRRGS